MESRPPLSAVLPEEGETAGPAAASLFAQPVRANTLPDLGGRRRAGGRARLNSVQTPESNPEPPPLPSPSQWAQLAYCSDLHRPAPPAEPRPEIPTTAPLTAAEETFRHSGWKHVRRQLRAAKEAAGATPGNLEAWDRCGCNSYVWVHAKTGDVKLRASYCRDRYCHPCAQERSRRIAGNLIEQIDGREFLHVTLTVRHTDEPLKAQKQRLFEWFAKLRGGKWWRSYCQGGAYFFETTLADDGRWHPHLHIIAESRWIPHAELSAEWARITGGSFAVWVRKVDSAKDAAMEVSKYVSKPVHRSVRRDPARLVELIKALRGARLCSTFGTWRGFQLADDEGELDDADEWKPCGRLDEVIARAAAGELAAQGLLKQLRRLAPRPISHKSATPALDSS